MFNVYFSQDCPGTGSDQAGKSTACQGCPNQNVCATKPKGPDPGNYGCLHLNLI